MNLYSTQNVSLVCIFFVIPYIQSLGVHTCFHSRAYSVPDPNASGAALVSSKMLHELPKSFCESRFFGLLPLPARLAPLCAAAAAYVWIARASPGDVRTRASACFLRGCSVRALRSWWGDNLRETDFD